MQSIARKRNGALTRFKGHEMAHDNLRGRKLSIATTAEVCGVHRATVYRWIDAGLIVVIKLGSRCTRIDGDSLADYLTAQTVGNTAGAAASEPPATPNVTKPGGRGKASSLDIARQA